MKKILGIFLFIFLIVASVSCAPQNTNEIADDIINETVEIST